MNTPTCIYCEEKPASPRFKMEDGEQIRICEECNENELLFQNCNHWNTPLATCDALYDDTTGEFYTDDDAYHAAHGVYLSDDEGRYGAPWGDEVWSSYYSYIATQRAREVA